MPLHVHPLEPRDVPAVLTDLPALAVAVPADAGSSPVVRLVDPATNATLASVPAYEEAFRGGVNAALGDVTGDGVRDLVIAPGTGGGPRVRVLDGKSGQVVADFFVYEPTFTGGVAVALGDVSGDGRADILTGTGVGGGPRVRVLDGATLGRTVLKDYFAYESTFRGGVNVAAGDVTGDGRADVVTGTGVGGGPRVVVFDAVTDRPVQNFFAYEESFRGGVDVATIDFGGATGVGVLTGSGPGGGPVVRTFRNGVAEATQAVGDPAFRGGVRVDVANSDFNSVAVARLGGSDAVTSFASVRRLAAAPVDPTPPTTPTPQPTPTVTYVGDVTRVDAGAGTLDVRLDDGRTLAVAVGPTTAIVRNGEAAAFSAVRPGDRLTAEVGADNTAVRLTAVAVTTEPPTDPDPSLPAPGPNAVITGAVTAVDAAANAIIVRTDVGISYRVTATAETKVRRNGATATLAQFEADDLAEVRTDAAAVVTDIVGTGSIDPDPRL